LSDRQEEIRIMNKKNNSPMHIPTQNLNEEESVMGNEISQHISNLNSLDNTMNLQFARSRVTASVGQVYPENLVINRNQQNSLISRPQIVGSDSEENDSQSESESEEEEEEEGS
jgi:hypothetical protein